MPACRSCARRWKVRMRTKVSRGGPTCAQAAEKRACGLDRKSPPVLRRFARHGGIAPLWLRAIWSLSVPNHPCARRYSASRGITNATSPLRGATMTPASRSRRRYDCTWPCDTPNRFASSPVRVGPSSFAIASKKAMSAFESGRSMARKTFSSRSAYADFFASASDSLLIAVSSVEYASK